MATRTASPRAPAASTLFLTHNDIPVEARTKLVSILNQQLADTFDLMSQTKFAHWNVKGSKFIALHKLFDELAEILEGHVDTIAERATALGGIALGTARQAAAMSHTAEFPPNTFRGGDVVAALAERYAAVGKSTREAIDLADDLHDRATSDVFTEVSRALDQALYFLEAHLQGSEA